MADSLLIKSGQVEPMPGAGSSPGRMPGASPAHSPTPGRMPSVSVPSTSSEEQSAVQQMQQAVVDFAHTLQASPIGHQVGQQETSGGSYLGGTDPFGEFLVEHYIQPINKTTGQVIIPTDLAMPQRKETATPAITFRGLIDSMMLMGTPAIPGAPRMEQKPDGVWGWRTQNALRSVAQVASALYQFMNDLNMKAGFDFGAKLHEYVNLAKAAQTKAHQAPPIRYAVGEEAGLASQLTPLIKQFTQLARQFKQHVLSNERYKSYIDQSKSLAKYETTEANLTPQQQEILNENLDAWVPGFAPHGDPSKPDYLTENPPIKFRDLASPAAFQQWMNKMGLTAASSKVRAEYLQKIKDGIRKQQSAMKAQEAGY
jgi:sulfur transfer protein SufE